MRNFYIILFILFVAPGFSQQWRIDTLRKKLAVAPRDTNRVNLLLNLANVADNLDSKQASEEAILLATELKAEMLLIKSIHTLGNVNCNMGDYAEGLTNYLMELEILQSKGLENKRPGVYNGLGNVYMAQGQYKKALENFIKGAGIVKTLDAKEHGRLITYYTNIGDCYYFMKDYDKATENYNKVIEINLSRKIPDHYTLGNASCGLGNVSYLKNDLKKALEYYKRALEAYKVINIEQCVAEGYNNIAKVLNARNESQNAIAYYLKAVQLSEKTKAKAVILISYHGLAEVYSKTGDFKSAYKILMKSYALRDSLLNEKQLKMLGEMEAKYETAEKDKQLAIQKADVEQKSMQRNFFIGGFVIMVLLAFLILRSYRQKKKANIEISKQKEIIEDKQKEIVDSIRYATRIQKSLMSSEKYIEKNMERLTNKKT